MIKYNQNLKNLARNLRNNMTKEDWSFINNLEDPNLEKKFNDLTKKYLNQY